MINFEIPPDVLAEIATMEQIARDIMRPQSRYYDEHEHERPLSSELNTTCQTVVRYASVGGNN